MTVRHNETMGERRVRRLTRRAVVGGAALAVAAAVAPTARAGLPGRESPSPFPVETAPPLAPPTATPEPTPTPEPEPTPEPVWVNGKLYDAYVPAANKPGQWYWYTCEFDAAWAIFATYGYEVGFEEQLAIVGHDQDPEPWYDASGRQVLIYGGDIGKNFCGDYHKNIVAKMRATAMRKVFKAYDFKTKLVRDQADIERCLLKGGLGWMKVTVDFLPYTPATWIATNGQEYPTAFTNDHAVVLMGFNKDVVVIRDVLGPTDTNWNRQYEYEVPWDVFWASAEAHGIDGLAVYPPGE